MEYTIQQLPNAILDVMKDYENIPLHISDVLHKTNKLIPTVDLYDRRYMAQFFSSAKGINNTYKFIHSIYLHNEQYLVYTKNISNIRRDIEIPDHTKRNISQYAIVCDELETLRRDYDQLVDTINSCNTKLIQKVQDIKKLEDKMQVLSRDDYTFGVVPKITIFMYMFFIAYMMYYIFTF